MTRLRIGCVGLGFIGGRHLSALSAMPEVEIVAVADPVADRARTVAEKFGARSYDDGVELINNEVLEAVWLCLPPFAHGPAEQAAVDRNVPFFVEKPLAHDLDTATTIAAQVDQLGLLTGVGYHWRHLDIVAAALRRLQEAPAQLITGYWLDSTPAVPWWSRRASSGGQLVEQTTHLFDLARLLVGEVHTVTAVESRLSRDSWPEADVPTASTAILQFSSGAIGSISSSCLLSRRHAVGVQVVAQDCVLELHEATLSDHRLRVVSGQGDQTENSEQDPISLEDRAFVAALQGDTAGIRVSYGEALRTHALACAADRSAREGAAVHLT